MANQFYNFFYDPQATGYDATNTWKTVAGTPAVSGGKLRFNAATALHLKDLLRGEFEFAVNIPAVPTAADVRQIGLTQLSKGSYAYFDITGTVFSVKVSDGTNSTTSTLVFLAAWAGAVTKFSIRWEANFVRFFVNGVLQATISNSGATNYTPGDAMSLYVKNGNSDNMDVAYIDARAVQGYA